MGRSQPALLTRMWTAPARASTPLTAASTSWRTVTSARTGSAAPPLSRIVWAVSRAAASSRSRTATRAPAAASARAIPRPSPAPPPVTMAARPRSGVTPVPSPRAG